jgi:phosphopantothenoylcysteine synthetase/decarboxylase
MTFSRLVMVSTDFSVIAKNRRVQKMRKAQSQQNLQRIKPTRIRLLRPISSLSSTHGLAFGFLMPRDYLTN